MDEGTLSLSSTETLTRVGIDHIPVRGWYIIKEIIAVGFFKVVDEVSWQVKQQQKACNILSTWKQQFSLALKNKMSLRLHVCTYGRYIYVVSYES